MSTYAPSHILPFPRGTTFSQAQGKAGTGADQLVDAPGSKQELEGKLFVVQDTIAEKEVELLLRCVRNDSGADLTITTSGGVPYGLAMATDDLHLAKFPKVVMGKGTTVNDIVKLPDPAYRGKASFVVPKDDLFYVVEQGLAYGYLGTSGCNAAVAVSCQASQTDGYLYVQTGACRAVGVTAEKASGAGEIKVWVSGSIVPTTPGSVGLA